MKVRSIKTTVENIFSQAGVKINGSAPWDIQVHDEHFYARSLFYGSIGFGESYVAGEWSVKCLDELFYKVLRAQLNCSNRPWAIKLSEMRNRLLNLQTRSRATEVADVHYNLNNDFYQAMLDKHMAYSCAYWNDATDLQQAQNNKLELICRKLDLKPGMRVLDIGCGWGSFVKYAATHYGVEVVGINISTEQIKLARERCEGLPVEIRQQDYRDIDEKFDAIVSVGMFEHVGHKNYNEFMSVARRCLKNNGLFLLHTIGSLHPAGNPDPWIEKHIFPNCQLPSMRHISYCCKETFVIEDVQNLGADYDKTLMAWYEKFKQAWPQFQDQFGERFYRMWEYYLLACAASSRVRQMQVWQFVLSPNGVEGGYHRADLT